MIRRNHPQAFTQTCRESSDAKACPQCGGMGWYASKLDMEKGDLHQRAIPCACMAAERSRRMMEKSGLGRAIDTMRLDNYECGKQHQHLMYKAATGFLASDGSEWLYLGGQPGTGKTHLCTAVCGELLKRGTPVRYMLWTAEADRIKTWSKNPQVLDDVLEPLLYVDVLYVDDLFKGAAKYEGRLSPTAADMKLAFEIFNARYINGLRTVISCEWDLLDLVDMDQGTFSRVYERCRKFVVCVAPDRSKNHRLGG